MSLELGNYGCGGMLVALPYTIYLATHWNPTYFDLDPYFVLITSTPLVVQLKIHLTLTISIAFERTLANRTSAGILISSLLFITIPSVSVGLIEMFGYSIFTAVGPFYIVGLLCAGFCNSILYITLNREMRELANSFVFNKGEAAMRSPTSTKIDTGATPRESEITDRLYQTIIKCCVERCKVQVNERKPCPNAVSRTTPSFMNQRKKEKFTKARTVAARDDGRGHTARPAPVAPFVALAVPHVPSSVTKYFKVLENREKAPVQALTTCEVLCQVAGCLTQSVLLQNMLHHAI
ncbi:hypothetical protein TELCIR_08654 [Teladorsagia circumcincta]|uniref:Uncharacterized protein n=1 Tax=Teladorsagia circumcincta TaxID=45464 RepID=A0A2G9UGY6_TELCI|nr:hypothetical protein TELCIR_08654 [Teladorsagia circumcincta]